MDLKIQSLKAQSKSLSHATIQGLKKTTLECQEKTRKLTEERDLLMAQVVAGLSTVFGMEQYVSKKLEALQDLQVDYQNMVDSSAP